MTDSSRISAGCAVDSISASMPVPDIQDADTMTGKWNEIKKRVDCCKKYGTVEKILS